MPTTTCPPCAQLRLLGADRRAAEDGDRVDALGAPYARSACVTWMHSSRVGRQHERLDLVARSGSTDSISGRPKAAVLPVPVCAWPITSSPLPSAPPAPRVAARDNHEKHANADQEKLRTGVPVIVDRINMAGHGIEPAGNLNEYAANRPGCEKAANFMRAHPIALQDEP